ncbi:hypothetical protein GCM10025876_04200 [Demequina litorisediminis]|uniref:HemN C-terminal domain-containing protein n=1 Tax=Demequina litorisediminis TaxID=1849022 RepID=A0ABQ6IAD1_9MICO|nr:hypothetical protein GCM10025876_04200 [Demequina litorisediminis]
MAPASAATAKPSERNGGGTSLPRAYAARLAAGEDPAAEREPLTAADLDLEAVMLRVRLADGMPIADLPEPRTAAIATLVADGILDGRAAIGGRLLLTLRGRLLADAAVRQLT